MADFKTQDVQEIMKAVADKREELRALRFSAAGSRSRNVRSAREIRKEIAQALTELRAREIASKAK